jgi:hypothetical protein
MHCIGFPLPSQARDVLKCQPPTFDTSPVMETSTSHQLVIWLQTRIRERKVTGLWLCLVVCEAPRLLMRSHWSTCRPFFCSRHGVVSSIHRESSHWSAQPSHWPTGGPPTHIWLEWSCVHRNPRTDVSGNWIPNLWQCYWGNQSSVRCRRWK